MNHSYFLVGIRFKRFHKMLKRNKGFSFRYTFRVLFIFNAAFWSSIFFRKEKKKFSEKITTIPEDKQPIFIIGHWRTGTTYLHQLLSIDQQFVTPSVFQASIPDSFLYSRKYFYPIMVKALGEKRPIDNVKIGFDEPQEDEYALLKLIDNTPLEELIFPKSANYFLSKFEDFLPNDNKKKDWINAFKHFSNKLYSHSEKQLLYKNPFHSLRLPLLLEVYPNAKFIHIYRSPEKVVQSSINMWNIVGDQNALKKGWQKPPFKEVAEFYRKTFNYIEFYSAKLGNDQYCKICFEEFEKDPLNTIKKLYKSFKIAFTEEYENKLKNYIFDLKDYKKGKFVINNEERLILKKLFSEIMPEYYNS